jgi:serine/threonine protein phosphatase PrpC
LTLWIFPAIASIGYQRASPGGMDKVLNILTASSNDARDLIKRPSTDKHSQLEGCTMNASAIVSPSPSYMVVYTQHCGKIRGHIQQDCLWTGKSLWQSNDLPVSSYMTDSPELFAAVADGVSVSPAPAKASQVVMAALAKELAEGHALDARLARRLQAHLCDTLAHHRRTRGSATTLAAVHLHPQHATMLNIGDSRVYQITAQNHWTQLSWDHTVLNTLIENGEAEANTEYASFYQALDSCLIADEEETDFRIHTCGITLVPGDTLLICTDGVHDTLGNKLASLFDPQRSLPEQVTRWRKAVLNAGAPDNLSLIAVRIAS